MSAEQNLQLFALVAVLYGTALFVRKLTNDHSDGQFISPVLMVLMGLILLLVGIEVAFTSRALPAIATILVGWVCFSKGAEEYRDAQWKWRVTHDIEPRQSIPLKFEKRTLKYGTVGDAMGITNKGKPE